MQDENTKRVIVSEGKESPLTIDFSVPDDLPTQFATDMGVQVIHTEFILSFFEVRLPLTQRTKPIEEVAEMVKPICVSRVAISAERIPDIITVLDHRFKKFVADRQAIAQQNTVDDTGKVENE